MKKNRMKRWIGMLLAPCLVMGLTCFPLTVLAADNLGEGETISKLAQDETMQINNGTIITNNGTVNTNHGTVSNSLGTVTSNQGTVTSNQGTVTTNHPDGTVAINNGTVNTNNGTVNTNNGTVDNNSGRVTSNANGTVNSNSGEVYQNFGIVFQNSGTMTYNFGTVIQNSGTMTYNFGTVTRNTGTVINNYGTVGGTSAINNYYKLDYDTGKVTVSGLTMLNGNFYILSTDSVILTPISGQHFTSVTISPEGATLTQNDDGTYTLSGVTENVKLTVSTASHSYSTEWESDGTSHWHECSCGAKTEEAAHSGGTATCEDKAICTVCGEEYGELAAHTYGTDWKSDGTNHWHECECGAKTEEAAHSGGTATCKDKAVCTVCGEEYGELAAHTYGTDWKSDGTNHWHECECGAKTGETAHSYSTKWESDGTSHWHECSCGAKTEEAAHSGGTATCKDKAVCFACGTVYGELAVHTYKDGKCTVCKAADPNYKPLTNDNPQTGDNSNMALWIALLLLSGGTVITLTADRKRKSAANK